MSTRMPRFFRQVKPKSFNYRPVFYDRKKELLDERVKEGLKGDIFIPSIRKGAFREYHALRHRSLRRKSNIRIIAILLFLIFVIIILILL